MSMEERAFVQASLTDVFHNVRSKLAFVPLMAVGEAGAEVELDGPGA